MASEDTDKTEPATPRRRQQARSKGDVPKSKEVVSVLLLLGMLLVAISSMGANLGKSIVMQARSVWSGQEILPSTIGDFSALILAHGVETGRVLIPVLFVLMVVAIAGNVVQVGWIQSLEKFKPKLDKLSLIKGIKRLVEFDKMFETLKAFVKIAVFGVVTWFVLEDAMGLIFALTGAEISDALGLAAVLIRRLTIWIIVGFGSFAIIDFFYTRWSYNKKLRMSKQEIRDERKTREGDPKIKARMRAMAQEMSRMRMIGGVGEADVVVTNPTHYAVALQYVRGSMAAPKIVAKGRNHLARRIRREARKHGVPIVENPPLAQLLYKLGRIGREIPETLFQAVAEILAYISRLDPQRAESWKMAS